ncbi:nuclear transport factor 2 family protein [Actinomadura sp. NAK00032]|uniref:nuclear transport factor 2 family protein n=1 Tax=Actinomadura sp. NAK00032 TaxID=2742128 RepID=UPI00159262B8|nr:nuclear transport factor 2 family protein [Actinomadura sp. NAK00032]QKW40021.1 nuclear transport factor 2 family protein [Actinomadura sp. NAK00032]
MDDRQQLSTLVSRLGRWLDDKSPGDGRDLFTEDAEAHTLGGVSKGVDALVEQARRNHQVPTQHFITDPLVDVDGDRAEISANLLVVFVRESGPRMLGERYELETVRTRDGWRISRVQARPIWEIEHALALG